MRRLAAQSKEVLSRRVSERRKKLGRAAPPETVQRVHQTVGTTRNADCLSFLAEAEMKAVDTDQCLNMDDSDADDFEVIPDRGMTQMPTISRSSLTETLLS